MRQKIYTILTLLVLLFYAAALSAQVTIVTPYPTAAEPLVRGLDTTLLTVEVQFTAACASTTSTISFPASVTYVPGSVAAISPTTSGFAIAESNVSNLSAPVFNITAPSAGSIRFTVKRIAGCGSLSNGKDTVRVSGACGTAVENDPNTNTYNIKAPSLALTPAAPISGAVLGQTATRTITVINGGTGCTDTLRFYVVYAGGGIVNTNSNKITVGATDFSPWRTNGDTLFYKIYGATLFGGDNILCNGETVTISEPIKIVKCGANTVYDAYWSRSQWPGCQESSGSATVTMATGSPSASVSTITRSGYTDLCHSFFYSVTFTNTGTGAPVAAGMFNVSLSLGGGNSAPYSFSNFTVNGISVTSTIVGGLPTASVANLFTTDPDGAGVGLDDLDGDGYYDDLPVGKSVTLKYQVDIVQNNTCPISNVVGYVNFLNYTPMCSSSQTSVSSGGINDFFEIVNLNKSYVPANVTGGTPFRVSFGIGWQNGARLDVFDNANTMLKYWIKLPAGVSLSGTGNPGTGITITQSNDTAFISYYKNANPVDTAGISLVTDCNILTDGTTLTLPMGLIRVQDATNPGCNPRGNLYCGSITTTVHCPASITPGTCPGLGPVTYAPLVSRVDNCLGWTDWTLSTRQSRSNISNYDLSKALYLDTIQLTSSAKMFTSFSNLHAQLSLATTTLAPTNVKKLTPLSATVELWRSGVLVGTCTTSSATDASTLATMQVIDWNFCIPGGTLLANDSIATITKYVVAVNTGLSTSDAQAGNSWNFYSLDATNTKQSCGSAWIPEMYLVATTAGASNSSVSLTGCGSTTFGIIFGGNFGGAKQYVTEFRPDMYVDSIVFNIPNTYTYLTSSTPTAYSAAWGGIKGNLGQVNLPIPQPTINGTNYTFINTGNWRNMNLDGGYIGAIRNIGIAPNCTSPASGKIFYTVYFKNYFYTTGNASTAPTSLNGVISGPSLYLPVSYNSTSKPSLNIQNNTGVVQGVSPEQYWDITVSNPTTQTAPYVWLALEKGTGSGAITIDSVTSMPANTKLTGLGAYSATGVTGLNWYKYSTAGIAGVNTANFRVYFKYASCSPDSVLLKAGWNCTDYPSPDPTGYSCSATQQYLKIVPQPSQVQLAVVRQPGNGSSISLCSQDSATIVINSAQAANLVNPYVTIIPPTGVTVVTPFPVEYPLGSGTWYNITPTAIAGGYKVDLTTIPAIGSNGLPGTVLNPGAANRQAKVKVAFTTDCSLTSGASFNFYGYGIRPCGQAAVDNGTALQSSGVNITGASAPGALGLTLSTSAPSLGCGTTGIVSVSSTAVGAATQVGDTVIYTLPDGVLYSGGFTTGTNCSTCTATQSTNASGLSVVKIALQPGILADQNIVYSFNINASGLGGCSGAKTISAVAKRDVAGLVCGATTCTGSAVIIGNSSSSPLIISKPSPVLTNMTLVSGLWQPGQTTTVALTVRNDGTQNMAASTYYVEFFCGSNTTPMTALLFPSAVAIGATVTANVTLTIGSSCADGDLVTAKIRANSILGAPQCLCDESSFTYATALPIQLSSFEGMGKGCEANLFWTTITESNSDRFEVEQSVDGASFYGVKSVAAAGASSGQKSYSTVVSQKSSVSYYRLKMIDKDGKYSYSKVIKVKTNCIGQLVVYPNPVIDGRATVILSSATEARGTLVFTNALGQKLVNKPVHIVAGSNSISVALSHLAAGVYFVSLTDDAGTKIGTVQKVVINR